MATEDGNYITVASVRAASGAPSALISDANIGIFIEETEKSMEKWLNAKFTPSLRIDIVNGTGVGILFSEKNPLLKVVALKTNDTSIDVDTLKIHRESGKIELGPESGTSVFVQKQLSLMCKYYHAYVIEDDDNKTTTDGAVVAGDSIVITVDDALTFASGDWIEIYGMDGNKEIAKITNVSGSDITVNNLIFTHEDESIFVKLVIPQFIKRYMEVEAAIMVAINAIGSTYTFNASYNIGDLSVVKGVPYTHWRESVQRNINERAALKVRIKPRFSIVQ